MADEGIQQPNKLNDPPRKRPKRRAALQPESKSVAGKSAGVRTDLPTAEDLIAAATGIPQSMQDFVVLAGSDPPLGPVPPGASGEIFVPRFVVNDSREVEIAQRELGLSPQDLSLLSAFGKTQDASQAKGRRGRRVPPAPPIETEPEPLPVAPESVAPGKLTRKAGNRNPDEAAAQKQRAARIRESGPFRAALEVARSTADIWSAVTPVLERKGEMQRASSKPGEEHRTFTALLAGMILDPRARRLLSLAIDDTITADTALVRNAIGVGSYFTEELVVGSGWQAAVYNAEALVVDPSRNSLTIEADRVGGQFAGPASAAWLMNSRTRPEDPSLPNRPGTISSLNTMGRGVVQQSDVETMSYGDQHTLASAIRIDGLMSSTIARATEVVGLRAERGLLGEDLVARLRYKDTGDLVETKHGRIVALTGIGDEKSAFADESGLTDEATETILKEEKVRPLRERKHLTYAEFMELMGDETNPFPLKGWKKVLVIGGGDGSRVVAGKVLGYQTENGKSVSNLDRVETLTWVGQEALTKEQFEQRERPLYRILGVEFPRESQDDYYSRIKAAPARARSLVRGTNDKGEAGLRVGLENEFGTVTTDDEVYDHVVSCVGFEDRTAEILGAFESTTIENVTPETFDDPAIVEGGTVVSFADGTRVALLRQGVSQLAFVGKGAEKIYTRSRTNSRTEVEGQLRAYARSGEITEIKVGRQSFRTDLVYADGRTAPGPSIVVDQSEIARRLDELITKPGTLFRGAGVSYEILSVAKGANNGDPSTPNEPTVTFRALFGAIPLGATPPSEATLTDLRAGLALSSITSVEVPFDAKAADLSLVEPIAKKLRGHEVYFAGSAARLPLSRLEVEAVPVLGTIGENTVAAFRSVAPIRRLAQKLHGATREASRQPSNRLLLDEVVAQRTALQRARPAKTPISTKDGVGILYFGKVPAPLPIGANNEDLARYAVAQVAQLDRLAYADGDASFRVERRTLSRSNDVRYVVDGVNEQRLNDPVIRDLVNALLENPRFSQVLSAATDPKRSRSQSAVITLPILDGRADLQRVSVVPDTSRRVLSRDKAAEASAEKEAAVSSTTAAAAESRAARPSSPRSRSVKSQTSAASLEL